MQNSICIKTSILKLHRSHKGISQKLYSLGCDKESTCRNTTQFRHDMYICRRVYAFNRLTFNLNNFTAVHPYCRRMEMSLTECYRSCNDKEEEATEHSFYRCIVLGSLRSRILRYSQLSDRICLGSKWLGRSGWLRDTNHTYIR